MPSDMLNPKVQRGRGEEEINAFRFCAFFFFFCVCVCERCCLFVRIHPYGEAKTPMARLYLGVHCFFSFELCHASVEPHFVSLFAPAFLFFFFIASLLAVLTLRTETDLHIFFEKSTKSLFHFSNGSLYGSRGAT